MITDNIFKKSTNVFEVVKIAREMPRQYDRKGNFIGDYSDEETGPSTANGNAAQEKRGSGSRPGMLGERSDSDTIANGVEGNAGEKNERE